MIDQIVNNDQEIEMYYQMGSAHGDIRMMLNRYFYDETNLMEIIETYAEKYGPVKNINIDLQKQIISFDIEGNTLDFQDKFATALYTVINYNYDKIINLIDLFEKDNIRYNSIKNTINVLLDPSYYITLFRSAFIKHETCTSCILQF